VNGDRELRVRGSGHVLNCTQLQPGRLHLPERNRFSCNYTTTEVSKCQSQSRVPPANLAAAPQN
jgi:hypothetical protein